MKETFEALAFRARLKLRFGNMAFLACSLAIGLAPPFVAVVLLG